MKSIRRIASPLCGIAALALVLGNPSAAGAADKLTVVATFSVIGDMVREIAGDHVALTTIVGPGGDSELYQPTLADGKSVAETKVLLMNGINDEFEPWLAPLLKETHFAGARIVVSRGAKTIAGEEETTPGGRPKPTALDQHAWLDPKNGMVYVKNIAEALAKYDPANAAEYRSRAASYTDELKTLDAWAKSEMATVPMKKRKIITSHDSLQYLGKAYAITLISVNGWTNKDEPSAAELARLSKQVRQEHVHALFLDSITDPRAMQRIAQEAGVIVGDTLYGDTLSQPGGDADTYLKMIRHDITALKAGMLAN